jgi:hypothetical protein
MGGENVEVFGPGQGQEGAGGAPETAEETFGQVVRISGASEALVRRYADQSLIGSRRDPYGRRIFPKGTGELVRQIKAERLARNGRRGNGA